MSPVAMRKLELYVLSRDLDAVLETLGRAGCFQLIPAKSEAPALASQPWPTGGVTRPIGRRAGEASKLECTLDALRELREILGLDLPTAVPPGAHMPGPQEEALLAEFLAKARGLEAARRALEEQRTREREALAEARAFAGLELPFRELDHLSFLAVRVGRVPPAELEALRAGLGPRALVLPLDAEGTIVAAASKKGRFALDTELERARFRPKELPADFKGLPSEVVSRLEAELVTLDESCAAAETRKADYRASIDSSWQSLAASFAVFASVERIKGGLEGSQQVARFEGWVPRDRVASLVAELDRVAQGRVAIRSFAPEELPSVRAGAEKVPVLLKRRAFASSFERLVVSYGAPLYGTVDPTPLVAFFFVLLFSIMFGDLGQGAVIFLVGLLLRRGASPQLAKWRSFGPIFMGVGSGSMVMGFLDGTVFANEQWLVPLSRTISQALWGRPLDRFIQVMPEGGSVQKLFAFFGFTLGLGVLMNSVGLVVNIYNKWRLGKRGEALFSKTGLAGALFFWWAVGLAVRVALGSRPALVDLPGFLLPLAALFFEEPLGRLVEGRKGEATEEGGLAFFIKGLVEVLESVSYYFSNSLSFLRVGAFALSHAVLSFIVFAMGDLVRAQAPGGIVWEIAVVVIGNAVILVLEGMIVAIQVVRLQYYEFFSKFFTETGTLFAPFRFEYPKE